MATKVIMPQLGESVVEGTVTSWLKKEGDTIAEYESLLEVNTDKVDTEIPAPASGTTARATGRPASNPGPPVRPAPSRRAVDWRAAPSARLDPTVTRCTPLAPAAVRPLGRARAWPSRPVADQAPGRRHRAS